MPSNSELTIGVIMSFPLDPKSLAVGAGVGVTAVYMLNTDAAARINQKCQAIWAALTFDNVVSATLTCVGLSFAASIAFPAIRSIFVSVIGTDTLHR